MSNVTNAPRLNCQACGGQHTMQPTQVSKMSPVVIVIGWLIAIPSILGVLFACLIFVAGFIGAGSVDPATEGAAAGAGAAMVLSGGTAACMGISSLISGLVGYLLIMKKKVWKCGQCGYHIDRD